jgi:hypothetical protein
MEGAEVSYSNTKTFPSLLSFTGVKGQLKNERDEEMCIIIPIVFIHKRKKGIIYIRFPYMKYRRENILHAINLVTTVKERQLN